MTRRAGGGFWLGACLLVLGGCASASAFEVAEPLERGDLLYSFTGSPFCKAIVFFADSDPCHTGVFVGNGMVVEATLGYGEAVRWVPLAEFEARGPAGFRGSRTTRTGPTAAQRDQIVAYVATKAARFTTYDFLHNNQKGGYGGLCFDGNPWCWDGFDYFNEFDCVGLAERAYEVAGLDPSAGLVENPLLTPREQFESPGVTQPWTRLFNNISLSDTAGPDRWKYYVVEVPPGLASLNVSLSVSAGPVGLYLRRGTFPTGAAYDCRSVQGAAAEQCTISAPAAGTWGVGLHGSGGGNGTYSILAVFAP